MSKMTKVSLIAIASLSLALSACQKKAEGQVVAVVNGEEITLNELNSEIADLNVPPSADKEKIKAQVLQQMVERRLLAQAAKDTGLDRDPTYVSQERRLKERLLVSLYGKKAFDSVKVPDTAKIDQFIASHATMFADRKRLRLDQLQFDIPTDATRLKEMDGAKSMAEIVATLTKWGAPFQRGNGALDTAQVPPATVEQISKLPAGEPFIIRNGDKVIVSAVTAVEPIAVPAEQARQGAAQAIRAEELNKIGQQRLNEAKQKAKITYQKGYEPPAAAAGDAKAPSTVMSDAANGADAAGK